jgi:hypothetical protein
MNPLQQTPNNNMTPIKIKIDVTKIDKAALYKGAKGIYLDAVLWPTPDSQYGDDYRITQDLPKEARDAGKKGEILGNGKVLVSKAGGQRTAAPAPAAAPTREEEGVIPF